jgi:hypothetical protein
MSAANPQAQVNGGQSLLTVEWTNQHGCGGNEDSDPHKLNCNLVMQYMCQDRDESYSTSASLTLNENKLTTIRNGDNTGTQNFNNPNRLTDTETQRTGVAENQVRSDRGLHEPYRWYDDCYVRERNRGLFTADQSLRNNKFGYSSAIYTRQNPNGNRRGYECPEERDHYPYWHPSPWKDIVVFANDIRECEYYQRESHNVAPRHLCKETDKWFSRWNNEKDCTDNGGTWTEQYNYLEVDSSRSSMAACERDPNPGTDGYRRKWAKPLFSDTDACLVLLPPPECLPAAWSRVNHHGNGRDGAMLNYTWTIPYFPSGDIQRCVFRMRYNISTDDYDPWNTNSSSNQNLGQGVYSPVTNNPNIDIGSTTNKPLRLAVNTNQFGRTFQDRSHVFLLRPRGGSITGDDMRRNIYNLNVRGKRGNIVQTYPSVEYDFVPNKLDISAEDLVHFQWTGSNTHNNGNPAGDGQAGDAGEGTGGTDRTNIVETMNETVNYPLPWEKTTMFKNSRVVWTSGVSNPSSSDLAVFFASTGYYQCVRSAKCQTDSVETKTPALNVLLNNAPASFEGAVLQIQGGTYYYICSRNNNFTNRSQKGRLMVQ